MLDLVEKMASSGNKVLEAAAKDVSLWSKLHHTKLDLELFLKHNIVHLKFKPRGHATYKEIVCTSNTRLIEVFSALKESQKKKALHSKFDGISTKDPTSVLTYSMLENKYNTVDLTSWEILAFLTVTEDNIEVLDAVANELLKRPIDKDLSGSKSRI